jgi:SET domain-containing protein
MPSIDGLIVARSAIHGYGLITTRRFAAGESVVVAEGIVFREEDKFDDTYALVLPGEDHADVAGGSNFYYDLVDQTRWINHSCDPNARVDSGPDPMTGLPAAWWVALRDLEPGEELAYDYAFVGHLAEPCMCGATQCRGLIVDTDPAELAAIPEHLQHRLRHTG